MGAPAGPFGTIRELSATEQEPPHGAVLLVSSDSGTAVQRHYNDGRYHFAGPNADSVTYADLFVNRVGQPRSVFLIYIPKED